MTRTYETFIGTVAVAVLLLTTLLLASMARADEPAGETEGETVYCRTPNDEECLSSQESARVEGTRVMSQSHYRGSSGTIITRHSTGTAAQVSRSDGSGTRAQTDANLWLNRDGSYDFDRGTNIVQRDRRGTEYTGESREEGTVVLGPNEGRVRTFTWGSRSAGDTSRRRRASE